MLRAWPKQGAPCPFAFFPFFPAQLQPRSLHTMSGRLLCFYGTHDPYLSSAFAISPKIDVELFPLASLPLAQPVNRQSQTVFLQLQPKETGGQYSVTLFYDKLHPEVLGDWTVRHVSVAGCPKDYHDGLSLTRTRERMFLPDFELPFAALRGESKCMVVLENTGASRFSCSRRPRAVLTLATHVTGQPLLQTSGNAALLPSPSHGPAWSQFSPSDVLFVFPDEPFADPFLWGNTKHLSKLSKYWEKLFAGGYIESEKVLFHACNQDESFGEAIRKICGHSAAAEDSGYIDLISSGSASVSDSMLLEDESSSKLLEFIPGRLEFMQRGIHVVKIRGEMLAAFSAVLNRTESGALLPKRSDMPKGRVQITPSLLKKAYYIADMVDIPALRARVLAEFDKHLDAKTALPQLLTQSCLVHAELRQVARSAVLRHWLVIVQQGGMRKIEAAMNQGELPVPFLAEVVRELFELVTAQLNK